MAGFRARYLTEWLRRGAPRHFRARCSLRSGHDQLFKCSGLKMGRTPETWGADQVLSRRGRQSAHWVGTRLRRLTTVQRSNKVAAMQKGGHRVLNERDTGRRRGKPDDIVALAESAQI
jgi:hypothetical protein